MMHLLKKFTDFILNLGADPNDSAEDRLRKRITAAVLVGAVPLMTLWALMLAMFGEPLSAAVTFSWALIVALMLLLFAQRRASLYTIMYLLYPLQMVFALVLTATLGGFGASNGMILWSVLSPLGALLVFGPRSALRWLSLCLLVVVVGAALEPFLRGHNNIPPQVSQFLLALNLSSMLVFIFLVLFYFVGQRDVAYSLLRQEQAKSEGLLLNVLPRDIADILKNESRTIADYHEAVSILFADLSGFTPLSAELSPTELVELLSKVFSYFDSLVEKYGVEKIRTIGDGYMAAAGVPRPRADHAHVLTRMALEMCTFAMQHPRTHRPLDFRIGINSGPVVAGVIGQKKFQYDLWGDAVNTASRMESHGTVGRIQISRATYELIKDDFICEPRGTIDVKGKGEMEVWWVEGVREERALEAK